MGTALTRIEVPFNRPAAMGREREYVGQALEAGRKLSGDGMYGRMCETQLELITRAKRVLLTPSCTAALELAALLLDVGPGDEVIVPSYTFVSTANAFALRGARIVFCDVRADTLNLDEQELERLITPATKVIVVMHYAGVACEMDAITVIAAERGITIVEDNAHGLFGWYKDKALGTFGALATLSFHETKNIQCGEGGALLINDPKLIDRAEVMREKGTDRRAFFRGQVDKYTWRDLGSSFLLSELNAAYLLGQLGVWQHIQSLRGRIWRAYHRELRDWAAQLGIGLPQVPDRCEHPAHLFYLLCDYRQQRDRLIEYLAARGVMAVTHYEPLHASAMGQKFGNPGLCFQSEVIAESLLRLPLYASMTDAELAHVIESVLSFEG